MADVAVTPLYPTSKTNNPLYDVSATAWNQGHKFGGGSTGALPVYDAAGIPMAVTASTTCRLRTVSDRLEGAVGVVPAQAVANRHSAAISILMAVTLPRVLLKWQI